VSQKLRHNRQLSPTRREGDQNAIRGAGARLRRLHQTTGCADKTHVLVGSESSPSREGRTTTALDDRLTRAVGPLPLVAALLIAGAVYAGLGLALPLLIHARAGLLIGCNVTGAVLGLAVTLAWLFPWVDARLRRQLLEQTTNLRSLSAREFEQLVGELLRREGWDVEETGRHGEPDGNIDLRIRRGEQRRLVQCKRWTSWQLGVDEVRKLAGTLLREGLERGDGVLVTSSGFTPAAVTEAAATGIELVASHDLLRRLEGAGAMALLDGNEELNVAYPCPTCATPMILAHSPHGWWLRCPRSCLPWHPWS
jgi:HJR/Mrr/RecB family endonuclease